MGRTPSFFLWIVFMFGLYPAGSDWTRRFLSSAPARDVQQLLVNHAAFTAGIFHQPFGTDRGAVVAQRDSVLVLAAPADGDASEFAVVPDVQLQNLLWSFNQGYAMQWSDRELRVLTGCDGWDALLKKAAADFAKACDTVNAAIDGSLVKPVEPPKPTPVIAARMPELPDDDDAPWLPSDYLHDAPGPEVLSCAL